MSGEVEILKRGRGKVLLLAGFQFYRHSVYRNGTSIWRCQSYKKTKCAGSVTISTDQKKIITQKEHGDNCIPDVTQNLIEKRIIETCEEASKGLECAPSVYQKGINAIRNEGLDLVSKKPIPTFQEKKSSIYRQRNKELDVKKICAQTIGEVEVPVPFRQFLLADYYDGDIKNLVFCSSESKLYMKYYVKHMFMDGTFKCCPFPFAQVYSIHGDIGSSSSSSNVSPLIYALMSHKSKSAYSILFDLIKSRIPDWQPTKINIDFEEAAIAAIHEFDENISINGCHFHYTNCLWRKAKALKLNKDKRTKRIISLCCNLAHLPNDKIDEGWAYVKSQSIQNNTAVIYFIKYFQNFWMKPHTRKIWCVFAERHRTTNTVEGWHHKINKKVQKNETTILMTLNILFNDATSSDFCKRQHLDGQRKPKRRKVSEENDDFIREAQVELITGEISIGHFLDKLR